MQLFLRPRGNSPARFLMLAALGAAALLMSACATQGASSAQNVGSVSSGQQVVRATLKNGLKVVVVRDALAPVITQQITYFVGANQSPKGFPGMAHAQEHMMFRGSPGLSGDQLSQISAQLGGNMDAFTTENTTTYYFTVPSSDLDLTLRIGAIRMSGVDDKAADWQKERGAIEQEVARDNSNPLYVLESKAQAAVFAGTPYAHTGLGTKPSFDKTTASMLSEFHNKWYAPNNALLVVAGNVDPAKVLAKVRELYGSIPRKKLPTKADYTFHTISPQTLTSTTDQPYGIVGLVLRMPGFRSKDYPAASLLANVLDSRRGSLADLSYSGKALASGFSYEPMVDTGYAYAWAAFPAGSDPKGVEADLLAAVRKERAGLPKDLIDAQRKKALLGNALARNSISGLAGAWTDAIALKNVRSPAEGNSLLQKVTVAEVNSLAASLLDPSHAITLVLTPNRSANAKSGGQVFGAPESFGATPEKPVSLPVWASNVLKKLPHPKPLFKPTVYTLKNGLTLIVQPVAGSTSVSMYGSVHTNEDLQAPAGQEGVASLLSSLFEWGPKGMSRNEFDASMDRIGASFSTGTDFQLDVLPKFFDQGVRILSSDLLDPALPADAFKSQQALQARETAGRVHSPVFQFHHAIQTALVPSGDPSTRIATAKSIQGLTLTDVRSYYRTIMRPDETTIVVMGDVVPSQVRSTIEGAFGGWKASGAKPDLHYKPVAVSQKKDVFVHDPYRKQNQVVIAETLNLNYTDPSHYAITLGNDYLGGNSFASPLYRELRVKRGLVYSTGSQAGFSKTRGEFLISFGAYPEKVPEAKRLALQVLESMSSRKLSAQDLHLAKASELRQIELTNQSVGDVAKSWIGYNSEGLSLDRLYTVAAHYEALTAEQIQSAFRKFIDPKRLSTLMFGQPLKK